MLKAPRRGFVKTRLAREVGDERAVEIYRALVERQWMELPGGWRKLVFVEPGDAVEEMAAWLGGGARFLPQAPGDLGDRLHAAGRTAEGFGAGRIVYLGGDCPALTGSRLQEAVEALCRSSAALWPTADGGYCLLGTRGFLPELFAQIPWSTATTGAVTRTRARAAGIDLTELSPVLEDVDDLASWRRACASGCIESRG